MRRFVLCNPLAVQRVVEYIVRERKTVVIFRSPRTGKCKREIDISKLMLMVNDLNGQMPIEIPLTGGDILSADMAEDVFL